MHAPTSALRSCLTVPLALSALALATGSAFAQAVPPEECGATTTTCSSFGESFASGGLSGETFADFPADSFVVSPPSCETDATVTLMYHTSGIATGPFPGTFEETGTYVLGPEASGVGSLRPLIDFQASYSIQSGSTTVTGTKHIPPDVSPPAVAQCYRTVIAGSGGVCVRSAVGSGNFTYQATIRSATGTTSTSGNGGTNIFQHRFEPSCNFGPDRPQVPSSARRAAGSSTACSRTRATA